MHSDYFTVGARVSPDLPTHNEIKLTVQTDGGLTVFLVPRGEGVETKQIKTSYSTAAGTAYITFDNVKVPAENMLGPENGGLLVILSNFNVSPRLNLSQSTTDLVARTMGHVLLEYPGLASSCRGMLQVGLSAIRLWQTPPRPAGH